MNLTTAPRRATFRFMLEHPAHWIALGFGSGLSPKAPGTAGTVWAWISFLLISRWLNDTGWIALLIGGTLVGWWACTVAARNLGTADPSPVVWDEIIAFWLILWLVMRFMPFTSTGWLDQLIAFGLFRLFDAVKRGPVGWADALFKLKPGGTIGWAQGFGILFDDFVAAGCTLVVIALYRFTRLTLGA